MAIIYTGNGLQPPLLDYDLLAVISLLLNAAFNHFQWIKSNFFIHVYSNLFWHVCPDNAYSKTSTSEFDNMVMCLKCDWAAIEVDLKQLYVGLQHLLADN